jgi:N-acetyl-anhydromuramyl-L-alanine amidase AmpD
MLANILNGSIQYIVLHHTESSLTTSVEALCDGAMRWLSDDEKRYYRSLGYKCDYHWLIDTDGNVFNPQSESLQAFNAGNNDVNARSIAICVIGSFTVNRPSDKQFANLLKTLKIVHKRYPNAQIKMHKEIVSTSCPGDYYANYVYPLLIKADKMKDWDPLAWSFESVASLYYNGIISGDKIKDNYYMRPRATITREESFVLAYNLFKRR